MKQLVLISFLIVSTFASAQNYKTINLNRELYFVDTMTNIFAIKIDSIDVSNNDTNYYSFKTLREDTANWNTMDSCHYYVDDSWMGRKVIIKPNGYNIFINEAYDSIFVNTQANLGDTFLLYTYPNNDYIKATVTNIDTTTVLGVLDSVKTFLLITNNTSYALSPSEIKLGKESGLITLFSFFKFPNGNNSLYYQNTSPIYNYFNTSPYKTHYQLIGKSNPKVGITKLTRGEVYNFNIGDEFNRSYHNYDIPQPNPLWYSKVLNKYFSLSGDTVFYEIKNYNENYQFFSSPTPHVDTIISEDTTLIFHTNLNDYITYTLPEEHLWNDSLKYNHGYTTLNTGECAGITFIQEANKTLTYWYSSVAIPNYRATCFEGAFEPAGFNYYYKTGIGEFLRESFGPNSGQNWKRYTIGYQKGGNTCGTISTDVNLHENKSILKLTIYPNPTSNAFNYSFNSNEKISLTIYNVNGKIVLEKNNLNPTGKLNVSELKTGIYFVKSISSKHISTTKLIIN